jgi:hypothetical protein
MSVSFTLMYLAVLIVVPLFAVLLRASSMTTADFVLGPTVPRGGTSIKNNPEWLAEWTDRVIQAIKTPSSHLAAHRLRMKQKAREKYSWSRVARDWDVSMHRVE